MASNREVFQAFAAGREAKGGSIKAERSHNGALALYSYGTPIALYGPNGEGIFDARTYSVTTSKQQNQAKREFPAKLIQVVEHAQFRTLCRVHHVDLTGAR